MVEIFQNLLATDGLVPAMLVVLLGGNIAQFCYGIKERNQHRRERDQAWLYIDRLTSTLTEAKTLLEVIKAIMVRGQ